MTLRIWLEIGLVAAFALLYVRHAQLGVDYAKAQTTITVLKATIKEQNDRIAALADKAAVAEGNAAAAARGVLLAGLQRRTAATSTEHGPAAMNRRLREVIP